MANAAIGSLFVNLGINTAQFNKGLNSAQSRLGGFGGALKSFAAGALGALSVAGITAAFKATIDRADELGKTAQKIGLPVEELSKLKFAAELADVSLEQLSVGVGILSKGMASLAGGGTGEKVGPALAAIGVSAVDATGKLRPTQEVIFDVADAFSKMEDGAGKTALAMAIFGRSGKELIPLLNAGRDGLKANADEAAKLGLIIDTKTAKAAEQFNDNLTRLGGAMQGLANKAMVALIDKMVAFTDIMVEFSKSDTAAKGFERLSHAIDNLISDMNRVIGAAHLIRDVFNRLTDENPWPDVEANIADVGNELDRVTVKSKENVDLLNSLDLSKPQIQSAPLKIAPVVDVNAVSNAKKALDDIASAQEKLADSGKRVFEQTRTPIEAYQLEVKELDTLLKAGTITQDTYNRAVAALKKNFADVGDAAETLGQQLGETVASKIEDIFGDAIDGTLRLKDSLKELVRELAKVAFSNVLQNLLGAGNPSQGGGFLGSLGKLFGFAKGGTIFPGGSGGIDSQLVAFRKSPNERVDITKPGQSLSSGGGTNMVYNIDARGADAGQIALLRADLRQMQSNLPNTIKGVVQKEKSQSPRFAT